ncbi:uncharacterized protein PHALS_13441 [Plasmopara halstedii]|uniref:Uncharacterized protein n=1 Tax=Plasmopara halstedii TaxID=4781 RepID=A0A0P1APV6_PLAHL|nr:uncharacterized protein PHALS_13441 [Plasmopara halstedii]CEG43229.1 hypothetical protein PHALS_13441 [Plasmopara halstedii]|eukprot:XP_024579598.1 hypothetical protein PHALS_13441 [Plasmopara halstedii]
MHLFVLAHHVVPLQFICPADPLQSMQRSDIAPRPVFSNTQGMSRSIRALLTNNLPYQL